jgi:23S rRNA (uridine2552-2'-O)-methyltransferase
LTRRSKNPYARPDARTRSAKAQGYPARSVFKLQEIDERWRLLRQGQRVLDLGAAPGSWSLYASQKVGRGGRVVAVDLQEITIAAENVTVVHGDAYDLARAAADSPNPIVAGAPYDVVLSDMAPNTSGTKSSDQARSFDLFMLALDVGTRLGKPGASFVGKIFMSGDFPRAKQAVTERFETCRVIKPEGTRSQSIEIFIVGVGLRGGAVR